MGDIVFYSPQHINFFNFFPLTLSFPYFLYCTSVLKARLKVPKREIFDRSDFPDFYIIQSLCVGDFGVKIKNLFKNN
jgi:hypothetical protein